MKVKELIEKLKLEDLKDIDIQKQGIHLHKDKEE